MARVFVTAETWMMCRPGCQRDNRRAVPPKSIPRERSKKTDLYRCPVCGDDERLEPRMKFHIF